MINLSKQIDNSLKTAEDSSLEDYEPDWDQYDPEESEYDQDRDDNEPWSIEEMIIDLS